MMSPLVERIESIAISGNDAAAAFETELGWMAVDCTGGVLRGLVFGHASARSAAAALKKRLDDRSADLDELSDGETAGAEMLPDLVERLTYFASGEPVDFSDVAVDDRHLTRFGRRVAAACRKIGWGQVRSYGELAAECGSPGAARAVGQVMAGNRVPLVVPCHRVVAANGRLGGFSAPQGVKMKRRLLDMETIE